MSTNDLIIAISGAGGGKTGPQGYYRQLNSHLGTEQFTVFPMETTRDNIPYNISKVANLVSLNFDRFKNVYLMGWSMGGAVAILSAYQINSEMQDERIKGLILLAPQSDGTHLLKELKMPILFCHGDRDETVPLWTVQGKYEDYEGMKKILIFEGLDHDFKLDGTKTETPIHIIAKKINELFHPNKELHNPEDIAETTTIPVQSLPRKKQILEHLSEIFR